MRINLRLKFATILALSIALALAVLFQNCGQANPRQSLANIDYVVHKIDETPGPQQGLVLKASCDQDSPMLAQPEVAASNCRAQLISSGYTEAQLSAMDLFAYSNLVNNGCMYPKYHCAVSVVTAPNP